MKKTIRLGINTGFAINRFPEHSVWPQVVGRVLGLRTVQFTADLLNPALPASLVRGGIKEIRDACKKYGVSVEHTFTSAFTRVNHLASPNRAAHRYWIDWFKKFVDISVALGAKSMGSHLGILTVADLHNPQRRALITRQTIDGWHTIAEYARKRGLQYLAWEPMSIPREFGETIAAARSLHRALNRATRLPIKLCLDVDHGDVSSKNPRDIDPYSWIRALGKESPLVHLKQSLPDKKGHYPFIEEYNQRGNIVPEKIIAHVARHGAPDTLLLFEFSFREREPHESMVLAHLQASVEYWRPHIREA